MERVYTINIKAARDVARQERARKSVLLVRRYLENHMKGDVVLGQELNKYLWSRGIKKPPTRVKVKAVKEGDVIKAELLSAIKEPSQPETKSTENTAVEKENESTEKLVNEKSDEHEKKPDGSVKTEKKKGE